MRQIVLDTETTGFDTALDNRIIEIGCVELDRRRHTGRHYHVYINPEREIEEGALAVHGLDTKFLADKPKFAEIASEFLAFIDGAQIIAHNASFDAGFINHEFAKLKGFKRVEQYCDVYDSLAYARRKHPGQRNSLDALCKRYGVDNSNRELHGALLDAQLLAEVYLLMTGGQVSLNIGSGSDDEINQGQGSAIRRLDRAAIPSLRVIAANESESIAHAQKLEALNKASGGKAGDW